MAVWLQVDRPVRRSGRTKAAVSAIQSAWLNEVMDRSAAFISSQKKPFQIFETTVGSVNLKLFRTRHVTTRKDSLKQSQISYGLIIDNKVLFSGDTQFNPAQLDFIMKNYDIEVIFHDCDFSGYSEGVHASYKQLLTLPAEMRKKMYLCHYNSSAERASPVEDGFAGFTKPGVYYSF